MDDLICFSRFCNRSGLIPDTGDVICDIWQCRESSCCTFTKKQLFVAKPLHFRQLFLSTVMLNNGRHSAKRILTGIKVISLHLTVKHVLDYPTEALFPIRLEKAFS